MLRSNWYWFLTLISWCLVNWTLILNILLTSTSVYSKCLGSILIFFLIVSCNVRLRFSWETTVNTFVVEVLTTSSRWIPVWLIITLIVIFIVWLSCHHSFKTSANLSNDRMVVSRFSFLNCFFSSLNWCFFWIIIQIFGSFFGCFDKSIGSTWQFVNECSDRWLWSFHWLLVLRVSWCFFVLWCIVFKCVLKVILYFVIYLLNLHMVYLSWRLPHQASMYSRIIQIHLCQIQNSISTWVTWRKATWRFLNRFCYICLIHNVLSFITKGNFRSASNAWSSTYITPYALIKIVWLLLITFEINRFKWCYPKFLYIFLFLNLFLIVKLIYQLCIEFSYTCFLYLICVLWWFWFKNFLSWSNWRLNLFLLWFILRNILWKWLL